ncbi:hypothetical protein [Melittangium boletus]|uniref:hypothetical protein n=1 Tax=Melittangium boletus TaxID=83453 RepID=UPI003DA39319
MLDDLFRHHLKPGMTRREVEALLGTPGPGDEYTCLPGLPEGAVDSLCFTVSRGMDPCTLLLGFDSAGRFVRAIKDCS